MRQNIEVSNDGQKVEVAPATAACTVLQTQFSLASVCVCVRVCVRETCQARIQFRVHRCHSPSARTTINVNKLHTVEGGMGRGGGCVGKGRGKSKVENSSQTIQLLP